MSVGEDELSASSNLQLEDKSQNNLILKLSKLFHYPYEKDDVAKIKVHATGYKDTTFGTEEELDGSRKPKCQVCQETFNSSWLFDNFGCKCCNLCRNPEIHRLMTRADAKSRYLLRDGDLDKREPPLKFIKHKHPASAKWDDMVLYLKIQVETRAIDVWGNEENIENERKKIEEDRILRKTKNFGKRLKQLRTSIRRSLSKESTSHNHTFGAETYNQEDGTYHRKCITCSYQETIGRR